MTRTPCCNKFGLRKGPWNSQEDEILLEYIKKNGEGNWSSVPKKAGLLRCGKSCRLRWANYLRPNLKRGAFTEDEETLILKLHKAMGNKWAKIAAELPGRTDNDIKNFWNTRMKRKLREMGIDPATHGPPTKTRIESGHSKESDGPDSGEELPESPRKLLRIPSKLMIDIPPSHLNFDPTLRLISPNETQLSSGSSICHNELVSNTPNATENCMREAINSCFSHSQLLDSVTGDDESVTDSVLASSEDRSDVSFVDTWHTSGESMPPRENRESDNGSFEFGVGKASFGQNFSGFGTISDASGLDLDALPFEADFLYSNFPGDDDFHAGDLFQAPGSLPLFPLLDSSAVDSPRGNLPTNSSNWQLDSSSNTPKWFQHASMAGEASIFSANKCNNNNPIIRQCKTENTSKQCSENQYSTPKNLPQSNSVMNGNDSHDENWASEDPSLNEEPVLSAWSLPDYHQLDSSSLSEPFMASDLTWSRIHPSSFAITDSYSAKKQVYGSGLNDILPRNLSKGFSSVKLEEANVQSCPPWNGLQTVRPSSTAYAKSVLEEMKFSPSFPLFSNHLDGVNFLNISPGF